MLGGAVFEALAFEIDLRTARVEMPERVENTSQRRAVQELKKHLSMIAPERNDSAFPPTPVFVIGKVAPGCSEASEFESRACAVGGKIYFWGDDGAVYVKPPRISSQRWGTLYAV